MVISEKDALEFEERRKRRAADDATQQAVWTSTYVATSVPDVSPSYASCDTSSSSVDSSCSF